MPKLSAGILMYRARNGALEVFLVHPGGPFWAKKDEESWSIPKGEYAQGDDAFAAALREFNEETSLALDPTASFLPLTPLKQPSGKTVTAWAVEGDCDPAAIVSNTFEMEWPPKSGKKQSFPEIDRAGWLQIPDAAKKLVKGQRPFLTELQQLSEKQQSSFF